MSMFRMNDRGKLISKVIEGFKTLGNSKFDSKSDFENISSNAEDLLFALYKAGVSDIVYTNVEKEIIGPLIPQALQGLGYQLSILQTSFSSYSIDTIRIERSGLQFLIDVFKDFPVRAEDKSITLEDTIKEFLEHEDIEGLDERLKTAEFDPYTDDSERGSGFQAEIVKLPSNHWWFFN